MENKKDKIFHRINYSLMIVFAIVCVSLLIYYVIIGDPNNRLLASIGVTLLFILPIFIELVFRCRFSNLLVFLYIVYCVVAGLIGCVFNVYNLTSWYDIFIHTLAGYVFCFVGLIVLGRLEKHDKLNAWTIILFCVSLSLATELIWELIEWFSDCCLGQNSQGFAPIGQPAPLVTDTNIDLLCNFSGTILFILHFALGKFTKLNLGVNYIENEFCSEKLFKKRNRKSVKINKEENVTIENSNFIYRKATIEDLNKIWDKDISSNPNDENYLRWKSQYIEYNQTGKATTFVVLENDQPIGQISVLFSTECSSVKDRPLLCDGKNIANMNAFRIDKKYEGQGHISKLVKMAEQHAKERGFNYLTIGSEAKESRNLSIYLHFGYTEFITSFVEDDELILFYGKKI